VHALKRVAGRTRDKAPQTGESFAPSAFAEVAERAGVSVEAVFFTAYLVLPAPLDDLFPRVSARLGALAERRAQRLGGLLATQALYVCRKSTRAPFSGGSRRDGRTG
jgi:hypothetical protein